MLKEHCAGIVIRELDAGNFTTVFSKFVSFFPCFFLSPHISLCITGHCPHDEKPEEVNSIISEWIVTIESKVPAVSFL